MKNIVVIGSYFRDFRELARTGLDKKFNLIFDEYSQSWTTLIEPHLVSKHELYNELDNFIQNYINKDIHGIVAPHDYPSSVLGSIIAQELKVRSPHPEVILRCQHKYYSRKDQEKYVPEAVPSYQLIDPRAGKFIAQNIQYPSIVKPVKSLFSINTFKVASDEQLHKALSQAVLEEILINPFNFFLERYSSCDIDAHHLLLEQCIEGYQCTIEGYVFDGEVGFFGVVDSIMYPGTISFERFDYPSMLPESVQKRMEDIATRIMKGIGFDNGIFNIEYMYDPRTDGVYIIEINPRMASQFADLYERVDGTNSYETICDIASGIKPQVKKRSGEFAYASSCVLRLFQNHYVKAAPEQKHIDTVMERYPDARIELYAHPGKTLAHVIQDASSFRYALIQLGGSSIEDILTKLSWCKEQLPFVLEPLN